MNANQNKWKIKAFFCCFGRWGKWWTFLLENSKQCIVNNTKSERSILESILSAWIIWRWCSSGLNKSNRYFNSEEIPSINLKRIRYTRIKEKEEEIIWINESSVTQPSFPLYMCDIHPNAMKWRSWASIKCRRQYRNVSITIERIVVVLVLKFFSFVRWSCVL